MRLPLRLSFAYVTPTGDDPRRREPHGAAGAAGDNGDRDPNETQPVFLDEADRVRDDEPQSTSDGAPRVRPREQSGGGGGSGRRHCGGDEETGVRERADASASNSSASGRQADASASEDGDGDADTRSGRSSRRKTTRRIRKRSTRTRITRDPEQERKADAALPADVERITTTVTLREWVAAVSATDASTLALDTEFIPESRYRPELCLVQARAAGKTALIDPLAEGLDLSPLGVLFGEDGPVAVTHAGQQDLALLAHAVGMRPANLFDTQVAGSLLTRFEQASLADLVKRFLGHHLPKQGTFTRWNVRPLDAEQLIYAAADVAHLEDLYHAQRLQLEQRGRLAWAQEECQRLLRQPLKWERSHEDAYRSVPKASNLSRDRLAILRELYAWRDEVARESDQRPVHVIADHKLLRIAEAAPTTEEQLANIRQMTPNFLKRYTEPVLERVAAGLATPKERWPEPIASQNQDKQLSADDAVHLDALMMLTKIVANREQIAPGILARKDALSACLRMGFDAALGDSGPLGGWRAEVLGPLFRKWRSGKLRFGLSPDGKSTLMLFDADEAEAYRIEPPRDPSRSSRSRRRRNRKKKKTGADEGSGDASTGTDSDPTGGGDDASSTS